MIEISATAESVTQAERLLEAGADSLYIGEGIYALRVPSALTKEEIAHIVELAHEKGKKVTVAVNALMHVEKMATIRPYLDFLEKIRVDCIAVGDAGVIHVLRTEGHKLPYIYDASTMVTSSRQINFWADQGAGAAVLARELPKAELEEMAGQLKIPAEVLVYGATVIHHTKRPLLQNYFNFTKVDGVDKDRSANHFLAEPDDDESHFSIFEDSHGTHIFANDDLNMMSELSNLTEMGYTNWKLDGIFTRGETFVKIVKLFDEARQRIEEDDWTNERAFLLEEEIRKLHPEGRTLSHGFYDLDPDQIK